ncbi:MAG: hypothetical protein JWQ27_2084 [Ferruginibacter sp.]|nr:hypothetical protein [Ferruginibacter sp.]
MNKKYFPFLALIAAVLLFIWVKKHQRGDPVKHSTTIETPVVATTDFPRNTTNLVYSKHARCRMECRHIDESEVKEILARGEINSDKIESDQKGTTYPLEGITHDKQKVRIVFAPHETEMVVVTVIDLDKEWPCNCN